MRTVETLLSCVHAYVVVAKESLHEKVYVMIRAEKMIVKLGDKLEVFFEVFIEGDVDMRLVFHGLSLRSEY